MTIEVTRPIKLTSGELPYTSVTLQHTEKGPRAYFGTMSMNKRELNEFIDMLREARVMLIEWPEEAE